MMSVTLHASVKKEIGSNDQKSTKRVLDYPRKPGQSCFYNFDKAAEVVLLRAQQIENNEIYKMFQAWLQPRKIFNCDVKGIPSQQKTQWQLLHKKGAYRNLVVHCKFSVNFTTRNFIEQARVMKTELIYHFVHPRDI